MNKPCVVVVLFCVSLVAAGPSASAAAPEAGRADTAGAAEGAGPADGQETEGLDDIESRRVFDGPRQASAPVVPAPPYMEMLKLGASLAVVLGLVAAAAWAFRRLMPRTSSMFSSQVLRVLARTHLGSRQMVSLVSVGGRLLVVGSTQASVTILAQIDDPEQVERIRSAIESSSSHSATGTFRNILSTVTGRRAKGAPFEAEVAEAVSEVSDRVAVLNRKLEDYERNVN